MTAEIVNQGNSIPEADQSLLNQQRQDNIKNFLFSQIDTKYRELCQNISNIPNLPQYNYYKEKAIEHFGVGFLYIKEFFQVMHLKPFEQPKVQDSAESKSN